MDKVVTVGLGLLLLSLVSFLLSSVFLNALWQHESLVYIIGTLLSAIYLSLWYYFGFRMGAGFKKGLLAGTIGASGGLLSVILSLVFLNTMPDDAAFVVMIPWFYPLLAIGYITPYLGPINNFVPHLSVVLVILLTAIGSWHGKVLKRESGD